MYVLAPERALARKDIFVVIDVLDRWYKFLLNRSIVHPYSFCKQITKFLSRQDYKPQQNIHPKELELDRSQISDGETDQKPKDHPRLKIFRDSDVEEEYKHFQPETYNISNVVLTPDGQKFLQNGKCVRTSLLVKI